MEATKLSPQKAYIPEQNPLNFDEYMQERKAQLQRRQTVKQKNLMKNEQLRFTREQLMHNVSQVFYRHIYDAERLIKQPTQAALLFHERYFKRREWSVYSARGYSSTMPIFYFNFEETSSADLLPSVSDIFRFLRSIIDRMQLATECIVICLIYIEKLMHTSKVELRNCNWRPLLFTSVLLASKFWEDISFWNEDYVEGIDIYALKAINRLESEFLSLCDYNMYVSSAKYKVYQDQIIRLTFSQESPEKHQLRTQLSQFAQVHTSERLAEPPSLASPPPILDLSVDNEQPLLLTQRTIASLQLNELDKVLGSEDSFKINYDF